MFEDLSRNLEVPAALGMRTVLVVPSPGIREVLEDDWEMEGRDAPHVDYLTDDLGAFLGDVLEAIGKKA
jgi:putative hydrolase of the HAD superfamily